MIKHPKPKKKPIAWLGLTKISEEKNKLNIRYDNEHLLDYEIETISLKIGYTERKCYKLIFEIEVVSKEYDKVEIIVNDDELDYQNLSLLRLCLNSLKETLHIKPYFYIFETKSKFIEIHGGWLKRKSNKMEDEVSLKLNILDYNLLRSKK